MAKKLYQDDSVTYKVIEEIAEELNLPKSKVKHVVWYFFSWQREAFDSLKYSSYLWNYFGTFKIIPSRYEKFIEKNKTITNNNTKIKK